MTRRKTTTQIFIQFKAKVVIDLEFRWALANAKKNVWDRNIYQLIFWIGTLPLRIIWRKFWFVIQMNLINIFCFVFLTSAQSICCWTTSHCTSHLIDGGWRRLKKRGGGDFFDLPCFNYCAVFWLISYFKLVVSIYFSIVSFFFIRFSDDVCFLKIFWISLHILNLTLTFSCFKFEQFFVVDFLDQFPINYFLFLCTRRILF